MSHKFSDYDRWFLPCDKCGYEIGRLGKKSKANCWKCGNINITRDYSDRALKENRYVFKELAQDERGSDE